jgi:hypothetical protein
MFSVSVHHFIFALKSSTTQNNSPELACTSNTKYVISDISYNLPILLMYIAGHVVVIFTPLQKHLLSVEHSNVLVALIICGN